MWTLCSVALQKKRAITTITIITLYNTVDHCLSCPCRNASARRWGPATNASLPLALTQRLLISCTATLFPKSVFALPSRHSVVYHALSSPHYLSASACIKEFIQGWHGDKFIHNLILIRGVTPFFWVWYMLALECRGLPAGLWIPYIFTIILIYTLCIRGGARR